MKYNQSEMIRVFSDTEINIDMIRAELAKIGIPSLVKNEFQSGLLAGFGASPIAVDLYVNAENLDEASSLIQDINQNN
jgi:hypothetical protein